MFVDAIQLEMNNDDLIDAVLQQVLDPMVCANNCSDWWSMKVEHLRFALLLSQYIFPARFVHYSGKLSCTVANDLCDGQFPAYTPRRCYAHDIIITSFITHHRDGFAL